LLIHKTKAADLSNLEIKFTYKTQEFQIELYNPLTDSVLTDIRVNGKSVSESGIVLRPGERFYLDCFVDDKKKFIFKTYEVEDSDESKKSIQKNGVIEIFFYKEDTINFKNWTKRYDRVIEKALLSLLVSLFNLSILSNYLVWIKL
jgi:hypothetical protein